MRLFKQLDRLLEVSSFEARSRVKIICVEESGIQFDSPLKFGGGIFELSLDGECLADGNMCFGEIRIELQRVSACALRLFQITRIATPSIKIDISVGQPRPGRSKIRVDRNRSQEHLPGKLHVLTSPTLKQLTSAQIKFVCFHIRCGWLEETAFLPLRKRKSQRVEHTAGDLILNGEDVFDLAIEPLRPKVIAVSRVDQLDEDAQSVSGFADAALEKRLNAETFPNLSRVHARSAKREARCAGRNAEPGDLVQRIENFLCDAITEVFLIVLRAEIGEWQDGDRANPCFSFFGGLSGV